MHRRSLRIADIAKQSVAPNTKLMLKQSSQPFSEAAKRNEGEGITSTTPSEQNSAISKVEKHRRDFYRHYRHQFLIEESTTVSETRKEISRKQIQHSEQKIHEDGIKSSLQDHWMPHPKRGHWMPSDQIEVDQPNTQEQMIPKDGIIPPPQDHWRPSPNGGDWRPA